MSGQHRAPRRRGTHRKPGRTKQYVSYAGTATAAGIIAAGTLASPAGAAAAAPRQAARPSAQVLHVLHLHHLAHLAHLARTRAYPAPVKAARTSGLTTGVYSYAQIEALWRGAGGPAAAEATAACIAEHESGGNPRAVSPTDDRGIWQINASHGPAMSTLDPHMNAVAAVEISDGGRNWSAWTTAPDCGV